MSLTLKNVYSFGLDEISLKCQEIQMEDRSLTKNGNSWIRIRWQFDAETTYQLQLVQK